MPHSRAVCTTGAYQAVARDVSISALRAVSLCHAKGTNQHGGSFCTCDGTLRVEFSIRITSQHTAGSQIQHAIPVAFIIGRWLVVRCAEDLDRTVRVFRRNGSKNAPVPGKPGKRDRGFIIRVAQPFGYRAVFVHIVHPHGRKIGGE